MGEKRREGERGREGSRATLVRCFQTPSRLSKREDLARRMTATMTAMFTAMMALLAATALAPRVAEAQLLTPKEYHAVNPPPSSNGTQRLHQCPPGEVARHRRQKVRVHFYRS